MNVYTKKIKEYKILNDKAKKNATVFFGADWLYEVPIAELLEDYALEIPVYNRSLKGLKIDEAEKVVESVICTLSPEKVFINLGENDVNAPDFNPEKFAEKYEWLLYTLHAKCNCELYILSIAGEQYGAVNVLLRKIAEKYECTYIDTQNCCTSFLQFFSKIRFFLRKQPITFFQAMNM